MHREEALGILGLAPAEAKDFAAVRVAYHRRMRAVHPDLNDAPEAAAAAAMVSAAYDFLDRSYRAQKKARLNREAVSAREADTGSTPTGRRPGAGRARVRVLNDTTITVMGTRSGVLELARSAAELIGEVSSIDGSSGMILITAEFLHMPPSQVTLTVVGRGADRVHVRCSVESLSHGEAPPVAAVTRLVAKKLSEVSASLGNDAAAAAPGARRTGRVAR